MTGADALARRPSQRQRARAVRIYSGETNHVVAWADLFDRAVDAVLPDGSAHRRASLSSSAYQLGVC